MKDLVFGVRDANYPDGTALSDVAIWNEYGTRTSPPRPAFRMGLEEAQRKNKKLIDAQLKNIANRILTGRTVDMDKSVTGIMHAVGKTAKAATKEIIRSGSTAPNAPSTAARKGGSHPLYETGLLLDNVDYEVR